MTDQRKAYLYDQMMAYIIDVKDHDTDDLIWTLRHIGLTDEEILEELSWLDLSKEVLDNI